MKLHGTQDGRMQARVAVREVIAIFCFFSLANLCSHRIIHVAHDGVCYWSHGRTVLRKTDISMTTIHTEKFEHVNQLCII